MLFPLEYWILIVILTASNNVICASVQVNENNLRNLLTREEWEHLVGPVSHEAVDLEVVSIPNLTKTRRLRRSVNLGTMRLNAAKLGSSFQLNLRPTPYLLDPDFKMVRRWRNFTEDFVSESARPNCFYQSEGPDRAALSVCDGLRGIISTQSSKLFTINPIPKRLQNKDENSSIQHIITRRDIREIPHFSLMESFHRKTVARTSDKTSFLRPGDKWATGSPNSRIQNVHIQDRKFAQTDNASASDSFCANSFLNLVIENGSRRERSVPPLGSSVHVETAVFVDRDLYDHMAINFGSDAETEKELIRFVLAMVNAVQLLYHDSSLGWPVNFVMKRLEILYADPAGLVRSHDIDTYLGNFCAWQKSENPVGDADPLHWDHALILTGLDLYVLSKNGKLSSQVVGLAPVAGMCTLTSSCTVNEGRHFESVYVVAHEIGHNLGMRHDGPMANNNCDPGSYLMSPTLGSGKITWSTCSRHYLHHFLQSPQSHCLMDQSSKIEQLDHSGNGALPGERFDAHQQCMLKYGRGSRHAMSQPLDDICRDLHCNRDRYTWTSHPALEGTICGPNKWCRSGRCVVRGQMVEDMGVSRPHEVIDGGWSEWSVFSDCASACLHGESGGLRTGSIGVMVSGRRCNNPRPENGGEACQGSDKKYKTCEAEQCSHVARTTVQDFADQICSRAKEVDSELIGTGIQRTSSDAEEVCTVWCYKRNGGYKSRGWTFPDGTACYMRRSSKSMYCISGVCREFLCDKFATENSVYLHSPELCVQRQHLISRDKRREVPIGSWVPTTECHSNCMGHGSGITLVEKKICKMCNSTINLRLCRYDETKCGKVVSVADHATKICTKYSAKVRRLSGLGMQISAVSDDPDRPCRLACQDEAVKHRFYLVNGEDGWFPFGTDCSLGNSARKAYCISGKCLEFGDDGMPLLELDGPMLRLHRVRRGTYRNQTSEPGPRSHLFHHIISEIQNLGKLDRRKKPLQYSIDFNNPIVVKHSYLPTQDDSNKIEGILMKLVT
nr:PREDICTED: A disintegrin and metalloproteinase with thrombospondin motifs 16-like [Bemisia tabaci]